MEKPLQNTSIWRPVLQDPAVTLDMKSLPLNNARVILRSPTTKDATELIALNRASRVLHRSYVSPPRTPETFADLLRRSRREDSACLLICRAEEGAIIGAINWSQIFRQGFQSAYLGYYIGAPHAGQGYMTEALVVALRYTFQQLKLHRLEANIQPGNVASIALVTRAGFVREGYSRRYLKIGGRWRDHERWAIIAEDWMSKNKR
jgi:ribosomal-protein-alanine N-acetyltransferase